MSKGTDALVEAAKDFMELFVIDIGDDRFLSVQDIDHNEMANRYEALSAALVQAPVQREQPVAWVIPGDDNARADGFLDAMAWQEGEFTRPLYAALALPLPVQEQKDMKLEITKEWFEKRAAQEGDLEIGAGKRLTSTLNLTDAEIANFERLAFEALPAWARRELTELRALHPETASVREGWKLVPPVATSEMVSAWEEAYDKATEGSGHVWAWEDAYRAMLAASPTEGQTVKEGE
jgi:hypothetical protein